MFYFFSNFFVGATLSKIKNGGAVKYIIRNVIFSVSCGLSSVTTGTDRPGLFYDVFDKNFQNVMPIWAI
jgi:hypothetical protein